MEARFCNDNPFFVEAISRGGQPIKKIRELRGSLALNVGGPIKNIVVKSFLKNVKKNKSLQDAALKAAAVTGKVDYQQHPDKEVAAAETVTITLRWKRDPVVACDIYEAGKLIVRQDGNTAVSSDGLQSATSWHLLRKRLVPNVDLLLCVQENTRTVRVPFVLKDIQVMPPPKDKE